MAFRLKTKQTSPFFWKRVKYFLSRLFGTRLQKAKGIYFVQMNGQWFKRLTYCDSYQVSVLEQNLKAFCDTSYFPSLATSYESELWVTFVEGEMVRNVDDVFLEKFVDFYATLYAKAPKLIVADETLFPQQLQQDLAFLGQVGVLSAQEVQTLSSCAQKLAPEKLWIGFDYTDPVLKNFVLTQPNLQLCAVDVEGLAQNQLIGMGLGKAFALWGKDHRKHILDRLGKQNIPDFVSYYPFIELGFLAKWVKRSFFEQKWRFVNPKVFEKFHQV